MGKPQIEWLGRIVFISLVSFASTKVSFGWWDGETPLAMVWQARFFILWCVCVFYDGVLRGGMVKPP